MGLPCNRDTCCGEPMCQQQCSTKSTIYCSVVLSASSIVIGLRMICILETDVDAVPMFLPIDPLRTNLPYWSRKISASSMVSVKPMREPRGTILYNSSSEATTCPSGATDGHCSTVWGPKDHPTARRPGNERLAELPCVLFEPRKTVHVVYERQATCHNFASTTQFEGAQLALRRAKVYTPARRLQKVEDEIQAPAKARFLGWGEVSRARNRDKTSRQASAKWIID